MEMRDAKRQEGGSGDLEESINNYNPQNVIAFVL